MISKFSKFVSPLKDEINNNVKDRKNPTETLLLEILRDNATRI
jgi:hypothetical protein